MFHWMSNSEPTSGAPEGVKGVTAELAEKEMQRVRSVLFWIPSKEGRQRAHLPEPKRLLKEWKVRLQTASFLKREVEVVLN